MIYFYYQILYLKQKSKLASVFSCSVSSKGNNLRVKANKGTSEIGDMTVDELLQHLKENGKQIKESIRNGKYNSKAVRRIEIRVQTKSIAKFKNTIREITSRSKGMSMEA